MTTIRAACDSFLHNIKTNQPATTYIAYKSDLIGQTGFVASLSPTVKPSHAIDLLTEAHAVNHLQNTLDKGLKVSTRQRIVSVLREFYKFAAYTYNLNLSVDRLNYAIKSARLLAGVKDVSEYPAEKIQRVINFTLQFTAQTLEDKRDLAFIWVIAETGLRVSEACGLKLGQIDRNGLISLLRKGNKKSTVRLGKNARRFLGAYLKAREALDLTSGITRGNLPLFARHDKNAGKNKVKQIKQKTAQKIIHRLALLALGDDYDSKITCHKFRHYFITTVYEKSGGDIVKAQNLADHESITTTRRYTHRDKIKNAEISKEIFG